MSFVDRSIPLKEINSLIPRITSAINDIDTFRSLLVNGHPDGSLPNWHILLQRYSLLLGRLNSLQASIAGLSAGSSAIHLSRYSLHPLNPLPPEADVMAQETLFQSMNTMPLPGAVEDDAERLRALKEMQEGQLNSLLQALKTRLQEDQSRCRKIEAIVREKEEEVELNMRIGEESGSQPEPPMSLRDHLRIMQA